MTKAFKYVIIFVVAINAGPVLWGGMGIDAATGVTLTACGGDKADEITDTATDASDDVGGAGLETLWGFYTTATSMLADMHTTLLPAAQTLQCAGMPKEIMAYGFAIIDIVAGIAFLSYLRGFDL